MLIDTHCHLLDMTLITKIDAMMITCARLDIQHVISSCFPEEIDQHLLLSAAYPNIHMAAGVHPLFIPDNPADALNRLELACQQKQLMAIGEIGLDFYHGKENARIQIDLFEQQLQIARHHQLPVILHLRKSVELATLLLKKHNVTAGVAHAFSGSLEQAGQLAKRGFKIGLSGMLTYSTAPNIQFMAQHLPDDAIVLETDSPFLSPAWIHGKHNQPDQLAQIAQYLARLRQVPVEKIHDITTKNALAVFDLS